MYTHVGETTDFCTVLSPPQRFCKSLNISGLECVTVSINALNHGSKSCANLSSMIGVFPGRGVSREHRKVKKVHFYLFFQH